MRTVQVRIPETLDLEENEIVMILASSLYKKGKLSLGQAANLAGLSKATFAELLSNYGVSIINHPASEIQRDVRNA